MAATPKRPSLLSRVRRRRTAGASVTSGAVSPAKTRRSGPPRGLRWVLAGGLALLCLLAYEPNRMENSSGDTISARYWPAAILGHHTWTITPFKRDLQGVDYAAIFRADGEWTPRNGWGMIVFTLPFYAVIHALEIGGREWTHERVNQVSRWNAFFLATSSVLLLFFLLLRFIGPEVAAASSALFALGTWNWSQGTQGLFSQTACVTAHLLSLHLLWRATTLPKASRGIVESLGLGVLHALIWSLRPQDCVLLLPTALILRRRGTAALGTYLATGSAIVLPLMKLYTIVYDHPLGAYGVIENMGNQTWRLNFLAGLAGLLFSPNKGAIVFFPLLFLVPYFWWKLMPRFSPLEFIFGGSVRRATARAGAGMAGIPADMAAALTLGSVAYFATLCFVVYWHGTWAFGSRYYYDLMPYLWPTVTLAIAEVPRLWRREKSQLPKWIAATGGIAALFGVAVHGLGHRNYDIFVWSSVVVPVDDEKAWGTKELFLEHLWRAGSNENRNPDILKRIRTFGF